MVAPDAIKALAMLEDAGLRETLGLVITDHLMPGMNGPEFVDTLREQFPQIAVVVLSGFPDVEEEYEGLNIQFRMKPLPPDQLIAMVSGLLEPPLTRTA